MIKILGGIDLILGFILILSGLGISIGVGVLTSSGIILIIKSFTGFFKDFASWIDFLGRLILISNNIFLIPLIILIIFGILIFQRGIIRFI